MATTTAATTMTTTTTTPTTVASPNISSGTANSKRAPRRRRQQKRRRKGNEQNGNGSNSNSNKNNNNNNSNDEEMDDDVVDEDYEEEEEEEVENGIIIDNNEDSVMDIDDDKNKKIGDHSKEPQQKQRHQQRKPRGKSPSAVAVKQQGGSSSSNNNKTKNNNNNNNNNRNTTNNRNNKSHNNNKNVGDEGAPQSEKNNDKKPQEQQQKQLPSFVTRHKFEDLPSHVVDDSVKRALREMGLTQMTEIQHRTLQGTGLWNEEDQEEDNHHNKGPASTESESAPTNVDVLGRARTGTGKTIAFLLPTLYHLNRVAFPSSTPTVAAVIISPTRELAIQIAQQAKELTKFQGNHNGQNGHNDNDGKRQKKQQKQRQYSVEVVYGGTKVNGDLARIGRTPRGAPIILVATPGRLLDHLKNSKLSGSSSSSSSTSFADLVKTTRVVILDEADQLLEMGFRRDITSILGYMPPKENRQTMLFSATVPEQLKIVMGQAMRENYVTVDCIHDSRDGGSNGNGKGTDESGNGGNGHGAVETSLHVEQSHIVLPHMDRIVTGVWEILRYAQKEQERSDGDRCKIIVFFPVARVVAYFEELLTNISPDGRGDGGLPLILGIHSRKSQGARNRVSDQFRNARNAVLLSSDVSARGVDYPDVTHVIQVGLPDGKEQYIHRLGRTGRAGKAGIGWLVLAPFERSFVQKDLGGNKVSCPPNEGLWDLFNNNGDDGERRRVETVLRQVPKKKSLRNAARLAYSAWLGFYLSNARRIGLKKNEVVDVANRFAGLIGLDGPPSLTPKIVGKMGLKGVPGITVSSAATTTKKGGDEDEDDDEDDDV